MDKARYPHVTRTWSLGRTRLIHRKQQLLRPVAASFYTPPHRPSLVADQPIGKARKRGTPPPSSLDLARLPISILNAPHSAGPGRVKFRVTKSVTRQKVGYVKPLNAGFLLVSWTIRASDANRKVNGLEPLGSQPPTTKAVYSRNFNGLPAGERHPAGWHKSCSGRDASLEDRKWTMQARYLGIVSVAALLFGFHLGGQERKAKPISVQGTVASIDKSTSMISVRTGNVTRQVMFGGETKFLYGHSNDNKPGASDHVKEGNYISCSAMAEQNHLLAQQCVYRESG